MTDRLGFMNGESGESSMRELDELLGAYALDAVDPEEAAQVEDYLASNPRAAAEVQEHREVATMLAFSGATAPSGVWERITGEIDGADIDSGPSGGVAHLLEPTTVAIGATLPPPEPTSERVGGAQVLPLRRRRVGTFLLGAAAAAIVAVGAVVVLDGRAAAPTDPIAEAYETVRAAADSQRAELVAEGSDVVASGVLGRDGRGFVDATALPALDADQTYQLWGVLADSGDVVSIGILGADPTLAAFNVDDDVAVDALAITIERAPGVVADGNPDGAYVGSFA
ncbi:MAG: anti-sigma factor [Actinomycetota bacterium]